MPVLLLKPGRHGDERGWFSETWNQARFRAAGVSCTFVQDNQSWSKPAFVLRGIHFQRPPAAQAKLVRCLAGRIWDVAVDLRQGSPSFGKWVAAELSAENGHQLFVPAGFGHGFLTLEPETSVAYKVDAPYAREADAGFAWDDPSLGINWPLPAGVSPVLSAKDAALPSLDAAGSGVAFDGQPLQPLPETPFPV